MSEHAEIFADRQITYFNELLRYSAPVSGVTVAAQRACVRFCGDLSEVIASRLTEIPPERVPETVAAWFRGISEAVFAPAPVPEPKKKGPKS